MLTPTVDRLLTACEDVFHIVITFNNASENVLKFHAAEGLKPAGKMRTHNVFRMLFGW